MKEQKLNAKHNKGITLIALIITIVVLLILAVVTIGAIKESSIITHAQNASDDYTIAQEKEQIQLALSEWQIKKNTQENTQTFKNVMTSALKENAKSIIGGDDGPLTIKMSGTENIYTVTNNGNIEKIEVDENGIAYTKDLMGIAYHYNTMYNPEQSEIFCTHYINDVNDDRISDINQNLGAYATDNAYEIPVSFFTEEIQSNQNIEATITNYDGTEQDITFTTTDNKVWKCNFSNSNITLFEEIMEFEMKFYPNTRYSDKYPYRIDSEEYHFLDLDKDMIAPFYKITMLGNTIEFPYNCQANLMYTQNNYVNEIYSNKENINKLIVNFSNNTSIEYTKDEIFDVNEYMDNYWYYYTSKEVPVLCGDIENSKGFMIINMPYASVQVQITSIIVEENGISTKFNVADSTLIYHTHPGS